MQFSSGNILASVAAVERKQNAAAVSENKLTLGAGLRPAQVLSLRLVL